MTKRARLVVVALTTVLMVPVSGVPASHAGVGEGTVAPSFAESWGCGQPSTNGTYATKAGSLTNSERLSGVRGDFFGRTIGQVRNSLVYWTMPMSGGYRILVHERAIPALNRVTANLAAEQAKGNYYAVKPSQTYGFSPRTISGSYQVSLHGHGDAVDINTLSNPYRGDNVLITNMPAWFVKAWTDAGFCWGGDWTFSKDPQHFSWIGPAATAGYGEAPLAYPVATNAAGFTDEVLSTTTVFGEPSSEYGYQLADGDGDGLMDVFQLIPRENGTRLEYSQTDRRHDWCAIGRDHALDIDLGDRVALFGDYSRTGRNDLWLLDASEDYLQIEVSLKPTSFEESLTIPTLVPVAANDEYLLGDHNRDGYVDLFVIRRDSFSTVVDVYSGVDAFATVLLSVDTGLGDTMGRRFTLGDVDLDELPDLYVVTPGESTQTVDVLPNGYGAATSGYSVAIDSEILDVAINDYDGDGRGDLWFWDAAGTLTVMLGNTRIPGVNPISWHNALNWKCNPNTTPYSFDGVFRDDDGNIHESNIELIAALGITKGCNPPFNDDYCPEADVSRGEMAAFLVRSFGLTDDGGRDWFGDDEESVFQSDINRLAAAGVTKGCNPPANDRFCPDDAVSRGEMAAFLARGLGLVDDGGGDWFVDDDASLFEESIDKLATTGITRGCNPPASDRFCPTANVGRDEMASFLARASQ